MCNHGALNVPISDKGGSERDLCLAREVSYPALLLTKRAEEYGENQGGVIIASTATLASYAEGG